MWRVRLMMSATGRDPGPFSKCDINQYGTTKVADVQVITNQALGATTANNDPNADNKVNLVEVQIVINAALDLGCAAGGTGQAPTITDFNPEPAPAGTW
jgi:hypothetical protein